MRSSPLSLELAELRDGSTIALGQPDTGTLASAVFTQSGEGAVAAISGANSSAGLAGSQPIPLVKAKPVSGDMGNTRWALLLGLGALGALLLFWSLRGARDATPGAPPLSATSLSTPSAATLLSHAPAPARFSVQIASNPPGASVFEGEAMLGSTPLQLSIEGASVALQPRTFTVQKAGYLPYTIVQGPLHQDAQVLAELAKSPHPTPPAASAPSAKKASTPRPASPTPKPSSDIFMQR